LLCNLKGQQQRSPALTLRPEAETVDRALAKEISRDLSLMMLAASIAKTAIASLHAQHLNSEKGRAGHRTDPTTWAAQHSTAQHSTAQHSRYIQANGQHSTAYKSKQVDMSVVSSSMALSTANTALNPLHTSLDHSAKRMEYSTTYTLHLTDNAWPHFHTKKTLKSHTQIKFV